MMFSNRRLRIQNNFTILCMFIEHLLKKWGIRKSVIIGFLCLICASIIFPVAMSSLFFESEINIIHTFITYLLFVFWSITIIIFLNPIILNKLEENVKYGYNLGVLMSRSYEDLLDVYYLYKKKRQEKIKKEIYGYDMVVINIIYMEIFKLYFNNINKSLDNNQFLYVNTKILSNLESDSKMNDFYGNVFFNSMENNKDIENFNKIKLHIIDTVLNRLNNKSWFNKYYSNSDIFGFITTTIHIWWNSVINYTKQYLIKEDKLLIIH